ncbi:uncharacterized protein RHO25_012979 [Cercospora beticola]|uniref:Uncharacterized protein n=1 Tax=Cercospora beticola TaxID=122368 RepID=A0ABZ0P920_CERBT|nr:hypothetical protein RHO25_012979 [Cercospora beticola]
MKVAVIALAFATLLNALPLPPEIERLEDSVEARDVTAEDETIKLPAVKHRKRQYPYYWNFEDY